MLDGVTGVEDYLKDDVADTFTSLLCRAGIKTWVLSGDKVTYFFLLMFFSVPLRGKSLPPLLQTRVLYPALAEQI